MSLTALNEVFDYNYWARDRQLQACAGLTEEQFLRPLGNSFPSLRDTLAHLLAVEWLWLERWRGRSPQTLPAPEEFPTLAVLSQRWQTLEKAMREYVAGLTEEALECPVTCVSTRGQAWTYPLGRMILHLLHHQELPSRSGDGPFSATGGAAAQGRFPGRARDGVSFLRRELRVPLDEGLSGTLVYFRGPAAGVLHSQTQVAERALRPRRPRASASRLAPATPHVAGSGAWVSSPNKP